VGFRTGQNTWHNTDYSLLTLCAQCEIATQTSDLTARPKSLWLRESLERELAIATSAPDLPPPQICGVFDAEDRHILRHNGFRVFAGAETRWESAVLAGFGLICVR
jgi:hypothetical protein